MVFHKVRSLLHTSSEQAMTEQTTHRVEASSAAHLAKN